MVWTSPQSNSSDYEGGPVGLNSSRSGNDVQCFDSCRPKIWAQGLNPAFPLVQTKKECAAGVPASPHSQSSHVRSRSLHLIPKRSLKLTLRCSGTLAVALSRKHGLQTMKCRSLDSPGDSGDVFSSFSPPSRDFYLFSRGRS